MSNDKLAEARTRIKDWIGCVAADGSISGAACMSIDEIFNDLQAHAAEAAQPQPARDVKCPHVITSGEGTSHCRLAEQDTKDAARYRWLRDSADSYTWDYLGGIGADRVDAAVDAAMAKESER